MHIIVITKGKHVGNIFPLIKSGATVIGRSKQCDIRILDMMISRKHCQIESREEKYFIKYLLRVSNP